jgi:peptidoglycan/xylan/chitin deacetylase (PgdA/CDA1 family)
MHLRSWFDKRGPEYVARRGAKLVDRYGLTAGKAEKRILACLSELAAYGCSPTFPTPGSIVEQHPQFFRSIQNDGAELAVHSYDHVDLRAYPPDEACQQLTHAVQVFDRFGIQHDGFRCPYLSSSEELLAALPDGLFAYSSNEAIRWDREPPANPDGESEIYNVLAGFYQPKSAAETVSVPRKRAKLLEIPLSVPDDLQYWDGLHLTAEGIGLAWRSILSQTYERMELFNLIFHPELAAQLEGSFSSVLEAAIHYQPPVWIAPLYQISDWWQEKSAFQAEVVPTPSGWHCSFFCSPRATILVKGVSPAGPLVPWDQHYCRAVTNEIDLPGNVQPLVGLPARTPQKWIDFLSEQGYLVRSGETSESCSVFLDNQFLAQPPSEIEVIRAIENSAGPLVRFGRWPDGAKGALCISGDLDALSLFDYASRLWTR